MGRAKPLQPMKNPPYPGELVREDVLKPLGLTVTKAAEFLGVSRPNLSLLLNERIRPLAGDGAQARGGVRVGSSHAARGADRPQPRASASPPSRDHRQRAALRARFSLRSQEAEPGFGCLPKPSIAFRMSIRRRPWKDEASSSALSSPSTPVNGRDQKVVRPGPVF